MNLNENFIQLFFFSDLAIHKIKKETQMGKTLSVRCIVESVPSSQFWDTSQTSTSNGQVELKRTVDVPTHTVMYNLVDEVLQKFGYPKEIALTARVLPLLATGCNDDFVDALQTANPILLAWLPSVPGITRKTRRLPTIRIQLPFYRKVKIYCVSGIILTRLHSFSPPPPRRTPSSFGYPALPLPPLYKPLRKKGGFAELL
ncbi:hypothetical protein V9T40_010664 [Parthenolecanium corni]|uniref:CMP domain-containing protein n=1 Tax=Parthenolecanium corni TaxID=536013 RepID=A0AAN9T3Z9_9HEMI